MIAEVLSAVYEEILHNEELYYPIGVKIQSAFTNVFRIFEEISPDGFYREIAPLVPNENVKRLLLEDLIETKMDLKIINGLSTNSNVLEDVINKIRIIIRQKDEGEV